MVTADKRVNIKLGLDISVVLSKRDKELISKYHDPLVSIIELKNIADSSIKIADPPNAPMYLSNFRLVAHANDGYSALGNMQILLDTVVKMLEEKIHYLEALEGWEGKEVVPASKINSEASEM